MENKNITPPINQRFDGYLPVVIDVETGGVNALTDALLEIAAVHVKQDDNGTLILGETFSTHVEPFEGARIEEKALAINKIEPDHPFRFALPESKVLPELFEFVSRAISEAECRRAILVGHNAHFDLDFLQAAIKRNKIKDNPFHSFTCFDTATLSGLAYGKTILAKALKAAQIPFDKEAAHSALYDAERTAELFCKIINHHPLI